MANDVTLMDMKVGEVGVGERQGRREDKEKDGKRRERGINKY